MARDYRSNSFITEYGGAKPHPSFISEINFKADHDQILTHSSIQHTDICNSAAKIFLIRNHYCLFVLIQQFSAMSGPFYVFQ